MLTFNTTLKIEHRHGGFRCHGDITINVRVVGANEAAAPEVDVICSKCKSVIAFGLTHEAAPVPAPEPARPTAGAFDPTAPLAGATPNEPGPPGSPTGPALPEVTDAEAGDPAPDTAAATE